MSYNPNEKDSSEFIYGWNSQSQSMPSRSGGTVDNYNHTFNLNSIKTTKTLATLDNNTLSTNGPSALWTGDIRVNGTSDSGNQYSIEFEDNDLIRMASNQDERWAYRDDQCYSVHKNAKLKMELVRVSTGSTVAPYVRIFGICLEQ